MSISPFPKTPPVSFLWREGTRFPMPFPEGERRLLVWSSARLGEGACTFTAQGGEWVCASRGVISPGVRVADIWWTWADGDPWTRVSVMARTHDKMVHSSWLYSASPDDVHVALNDVLSRLVVAGALHTDVPAWKADKAPEQPVLRIAADVQNNRWSDGTEVPQLTAKEWRNLAPAVEMGQVFCRGGRVQLSNCELSFRDLPGDKPEDCPVCTGTCLVSERVRGNSPSSEPYLEDHGPA